MFHQMLDQLWNAKATHMDCYNDDGDGDGGVLYARVLSIHIVLHLNHIQDNRIEPCNFDHLFV